VPQAADTDLVVEVDVQEAIGDTVIGVPAEEVVVADAFESRERLVAAEPVTAPDAPHAVPVEVGVPEELASEEDVVEAPASSRRPVAPEPEERLAEMAFGAEEPRPPRHTPPPESGRLPAAPQEEFDGDVTGVREAATAAEPRRPRELEPEAIQADLASSEVVVDVIGEAQRFAPSTFVALLDASLAL
jgi:hypothetical protein